jgi:hypothetical protein
VQIEGDGMQRQEIHVSDQELLLLEDGELPPGRCAEIRSHLEACWSCRTRVKEIENTISDFVHVHRSEFDPQLPPIAGPRALLKARLVESAAGSQKVSWFGGLRPLFTMRARTYGLAISIVVAGLLFVSRLAWSPQHSSMSVKAQATPNHELTPGATRPVTRNEICSVGYRDMNRMVPSAVQQEVFKKYGIPVALKKDYEVDYLITPELGGADDVQNLWPEPYSSTDWGAHVKDALEDRLHQMVCEGAIDLATAQREMASDWISAYKKYFHTDRPVFMDSANPPERSDNKVVSGKST